MRTRHGTGPPGGGLFVEICVCDFVLIITSRCWLLLKKAQLRDLAAYRARWLECAALPRPYVILHNAAERGDGLRPTDARQIEADLPRSAVESLPIAADALPEKTKKKRKETARSADGREAVLHALVHAIALSADHVPFTDSNGDRPDFVDIVDPVGANPVCI